MTCNGVQMKPFHSGVSEGVKVLCSWQENYPKINTVGAVNINHISLLTRQFKFEQNKIIIR